MRIIYLEASPLHLRLVNRIARISSDEIWQIDDAGELLKQNDARAADIIITEVDRNPDLLVELAFLPDLRAGGVTVPIIVLTEHLFDEYERSSYASGCNVHIIRPNTPFTLMRLLDKFRT